MLVGRALSDHTHFQKKGLRSTDIHAVNHCAKKMGEVSRIRGHEVVGVAADGRQKHRPVFRGVKDNRAVNNINRTNELETGPNESPPVSPTCGMLVHIPFDFTETVVGRGEGPTGLWCIFNQQSREPFADQQAARIVEVSRKTITA